MKQLKSISTADGINQWNNFVRENASNPPFSFNPSLLSFYSDYFDWNPYYFLIYTENQIVGVFPLIDTGRKFVSLPHFSYGGILSSETSEYSIISLIQKLIGLIQDENPNPGFLTFHIEKKYSSIGNFDRKNEKLFIRSLWDFNAATKSNKVSSFIQLPESNADMLKLLSSNLRRKLRKTMTNGLEARQGGPELLDDFYRVYSHNIHRLGSPVYAKSFFQAIFDKYENGNARIFLSKLNGKTIGAAFLMSYFGFYENTWFSTNRAYKKYQLSDHLHWQMIQYAIENKANIYSLGRSTESENVHHYKKHWPVVDKPLYQMDMEKGLQLKNQRWLAELWKITPYPITLRLGPKLVKHIY